LAPPGAHRLPLLVSLSDALLQHPDAIIINQI
jgi:hypothetical protein